MSSSIQLLAERLIAEGVHDLPAHERKLLERIARRLGVARNWSDDDAENRTFGQKIADQVAYWGGSWLFIIGFAGVMAVWIVFNIAAATGAFDPYPFILLNLVLSTLAAIQAPIIMMSQNRQSARDRLQALHDYEVNLKAEMEIVALHDKLDRLRIEDIARKAGLSVYQFEQRVSRLFQMTPLQLLHKLRLDEATRLLRETSLSLGEIALQTGWCDQSALTRHFTRYAGMAPGRFRSLLPTR